MTKVQSEYALETALAVMGKLSETMIKNQKRSTEVQCSFVESMIHLGYDAANMQVWLGVVSAGIAVIQSGMMGICAFKQAKLMGQKGVLDAETAQKLKAADADVAAAARPVPAAEGVQVVAEPAPAVDPAAGVGAPAPAVDPAAGVGAPAPAVDPAAPVPVPVSGEVGAPAPESVARVEGSAAPKATRADIEASHKSQGEALDGKIKTYDTLTQIGLNLPNVLKLAEGFINARMKKDQTQEEAYRTCYQKLGELQQQGGGVIQQQNNIDLLGAQRALATRA